MINKSLYTLVAMLIFSPLFGNHEINITELRKNWHSFLPTVLRNFPTSEQVNTYQTHSNVQVYEPPKFTRSIIWVTGNAFIFEEPQTHIEFLHAFAEITESKIFALSHQKVPEISYDELKQEILETVDLLCKDECLPQEMPIVFAGDSSGALIVTELLPKILDKTPVDQLLLIAPAFDMKCFLEDAPALENFPKEAQDEVSNQCMMMQFLASLLYPDHYPREENEKLDWIASLSNIPNLPKIHLVCFEYDVFCPQALQLQKAIPNVSLELLKRHTHSYYLLKDANEFPSDDVFVFSLKDIFPPN